MKKLTPEQQLLKDRVADCFAKLKVQMDEQEESMRLLLKPMIRFRVLRGADRFVVLRRRWLGGPVQWIGCWYFRVEV